MFANNSNKKKESHFLFNVYINIWLTPSPLPATICFWPTPYPLSCRHPSWMAPKVNVIVIYAQTHSWSLKEPPIYEYFYNKFHRVISKHPKNENLLLILSDFNAKTSSFQKVSYPYIIRQYDKGHLSLIGEYLVEYAKENNLVLIPYLPTSSVI